MTVVKTIDERFTEFHAAHPEVYAEIVALASEVRVRGRRRTGMKAIFEVIRWNRYLDVGEDGFKLNNIFTSRYVRLLAQDYPDLAELFVMRELRAA